MKQISQIQTDDRVLGQIQQNITNVINPILKANPILFGTMIQNVSLAVGSNLVNTGLSQALQGWFIIRKRGQAGIYDTQDTNTSASSTLALVSDAVVSIDLLVF